MKKDVDMVLTPREAAVEEELKAAAAKRAGVRVKDITGIRFIRKSIDARRKDVKINARIRVVTGGDADEPFEKTVFSDACTKDCIVVGAGPAGLFAALTLLEHGWRPIVLERGKDVHARKRDTAGLCREGVLDPESNYAFGEGGAGAFSDGKLYTRSDKRGDVSKVLSLLCQHGASGSILYEAHPHIGSEKLPGVIENMRKTIVTYGGEVRFETRVTGLIRKNDRVLGVTSTGGEFMGPVILATGHSANDVYHFLQDGGYDIEAKDVAVGVRLEHPQKLIDTIQYHNPKGRGEYLPPASYSFVTQVNGRGVYSFCMCPGGIIVPAATESGHQVVNGMSPSNRGGEWANSAMVVQLKCTDIDCPGPLSMLEYIRSIEQKCFYEGFCAPAQRMKDFTERRISKDLPGSSYIPGLVSVSMDDVLPSLVAEGLRGGFQAFSSMTRGAFLTNDAVMIAPETRTSSPVRICRKADFSQIRGLYPCGEGAGYAGGIVSAALDGIACAKALMGESQS
ncbi:MAG: NAD(P)/FAD-dependent oxidoreductase [Bullifex sp.]